MKIQNFVNGKWVASSRSRPLTMAATPLTSNATDELCLLHHDHADDRGIVEVALEGARLSHQQALAGEVFALPERLALLQAVQKALAHQRSEMATLIADEVAKPLALAHGEVDRALLTLEATLQAAENLLGLQPRTQSLRFAAEPHGTVNELRKSRGPVFCITPFNFPLNLVMHKVAPALASASPVLLKVSTKAARVGTRLVKIFEEAGVPAGFLNLIHCDNELATEVSRDARLAHVTFTGSDSVGWKLKETVHASCTLELGGNAAVYIHKDAALKKAAKKLAESAFGYAGQSCISLQNLFVHQDVYDNFRALMIQNLHQLRWGEPQNLDTRCSWVIDESAAKKIRERLDRATRAGATVAARAEPPSGWTWDQLAAHPTAVPPTLLENVNLQDEIVTQELFAPVVNLHRVESEFDYYDWIASAEFRLQTAVWTADVQTHLAKLTALDFGGVLINESPSFRFDPVAYGGRGRSGLGVEGPEHVIRELTHPTVVVIGY
ncbi:MAG TPA: aldehyde dehydrogenase family protein [Bdellovibrionota bacterium]|nr:aldehyde dehydrogenase family protein [Bdellovibrionota bacterium]